MDKIIKPPKNRVWEPYVWGVVFLAVALSSLKNPALKVIIHHKDYIGKDYSDELSFCNVLFVGSASAALLTAIIFGFKSIFMDIMKFKGIDWVLMISSSLCQFIFVSIVYFAFDWTNVSIFAILAQSQGIIFAILGVAFLGNALSGRTVLGYGIIVLGIVFLYMMSDPRPTVTIFETAFVFTPIFFAQLMAILDEKLGKRVESSTNIFCKNIIVSVLFFIIFSHFYGPNHFVDAFKGELWVFMLLYAGVTIVASNLLWLWAVKRSTASVITHALLLYPILTVLWSVFIAEETINIVDLTALLITSVGLVTAIWGTHKKAIVTMNSAANV